MAHKRRLELCNRPGSRSRCATLHQPDLCRACSFHPAPSNPAGSHSKSIRNRNDSPVVGNDSRSPAAAACNTAPWRARVCQARLCQRSQQPKVFSLLALLLLVPTDIVTPSHGPGNTAVTSPQPGMPTRRSAAWSIVSEPMRRSGEIRICSSSRPFPLGSRDNLSCSNICSRVPQLLLQVSHNTCRQHLQRSRLTLVQRHLWAALPLCLSSS